MRNVEIKARVESLDGARQVARRLGAAHQWTADQVDTYFRTLDGSRLKLRQMPGRPAELIAYRRPDAPGPKMSDYQVMAVADPAGKGAELAEKHAVACVVSKSRELWLLSQVRIHLDRVRGLGDFVEFEVVLGEGIDEEAGRAQAEALMRAFGLRQGDLIAASYADLMGGQGAAGRCQVSMLSPDD
jgi:predicted adenylyl cyclase CyaB